MKVYYNKNLKEFARQNRNKPTYAEKWLWNMFKKKNLGYDFHRQKPLGNYIADFYCYELKLVIEVDGITHEKPEVLENDKRKDAYFKSIGLRVLRFTDEEVVGGSVIVEKKIKDYIREIKGEQPTHPLTPS